MKKNKPKWLFTEETLSHFKNKSDLYQDFISEGIDNKTMNFFSSNHSPIFGSDAFIENFKNHEKMIPNDEQPDISRIIRKSLPSTNEVIKEVIKTFNVGTEKTIKEPRNSEEIVVRNIAIYIAMRTTGETHKSISENFTGISRSGVSQICFRMNSVIKYDLKLTEDINNIIKMLRL